MTAISTLTTWFLVFGAVAVILYDSWAAQHGGNGHTISAVFRRLAASHPILPFALGMLAGHLLWSGQ